MIYGLHQPNPGINRLTAASATYKIHVLTRIWEESDHGHGDKATHCTRVIIARQAIVSRLEVLRNVVMTALRGQGWPTSIVILIHRQECRLIPNVRYLLVVKVVQPSYKGSGTTGCADKSCLVMRDEEAVLPDTALERFSGIVLQRAD
jgi:hypothetical protein